jgi:hypothetical protein
MNGIEVIRALRQAQTNGKNLQQLREIRACRACRSIPSSFAAPRWEESSSRAVDLAFDDFSQQAKIIHLLLRPLARHVLISVFGSIKRDSSKSSS